MSPDEWAAVFAAREDAWLRARAQYHRDVGARIAADLHPVSESVRRPVVLGQLDGCGEVKSAARLLDLALSLGWAARAVASLAADPAKGLIRVVTVRFSRHDERGFAAWWNGAYEHGWYVGPDGLERLAGTRMRSRKAPKEGPMIRGYLDVVEGIRLPLSVTRQ